MCTSKSYTENLPYPRSIDCIAFGVLFHNRWSETVGESGILEAKELCYTFFGTTGFDIAQIRMRDGCGSHCLLVTVVSEGLTGDNWNDRNRKRV